MDLQVQQLYQAPGPQDGNAVNQDCERQEENREYDMIRGVGGYYVTQLIFAVSK